MMKRFTLLIVFSLLFTVAGHCQLPPKTYYALFFDTEMTVRCYDGTGMVTFYLMALPSEAGLDCVELMIPPPFGFSIFNENYNSDIEQPVSGFLPTGLIACFGTCQYDWVQIASAVLIITNANPSEIPIIAYPGSMNLEARDCSGTKSEAVAWTSLYTNYETCPGLATVQSDWGAIKSLYK